MSDEERILRLENAFATLAELAALAHAKDARQDARLNELSESFGMLVEMLRRHDERLDELRASQTELSEAQTETEHKLAALVDAQIRGEEAMKELRAAQAETDRKLAMLADAQIHTAEALASLTRKVGEIDQWGQTPPQSQDAAS
jgi:chromosome segregation ATPase